jgi:uncharacterized protein (DUF3084 family)
MMRAWPWIAVLCSGCGLAHTIDREWLADISIENKLLLFDAENDVSIAVDERDKIQREIREAKEDIRYAEQQLEDAKSDGERARAKNDAKGVEVADVAGEVFALKIDYLEAQLDMLQDRRSAQEGLINVALARYELAKATLIKKNNVRGVSDIDVADFEEQVNSTVESAKADQERLKQEEQQVDARRQEWLKRRDQLAALSGGGAGSAWAEDSALWGGR